MSDSWWPHGLQHARLPCPSPSPGPCSNTCPQSWWCHPTILSSVIPFSSCPQSFPASRSFLMSQLFRWPKYWSFSFSISPSDEYSGLISFRMDWFDLHAVQGTLKSLHQHHSSRASVLWQLKSISSAYFMVQLSHPYTTTGKTIALTILTFVGKVMSLLFNMLPRLVKEQTSFNFMAAVTICNDFGAQENKACHCFHCFSTYLPWNDGTECHDLHFLNVKFSASFFTLLFHLHQEAV